MCERERVRKRERERAREEEERAPHGGISPQMYQQKVPEIDMIHVRLYVYTYIHIYVETYIYTCVDKDIRM